MQFSEPTIMQLMTGLLIWYPANMLQQFRQHTKLGVCQKILLDSFIVVVEDPLFSLKIKGRKIYLLDGEPIRFKVLKNKPKNGDFQKR
mmetsp:Transcript_10115/g.13891  ORF Transcript_10115/g.13891 Transcript_10115/m.13891 type:complete len:88 (+) Transcript_10115:1199-1462(+)